MGRQQNSSMHHPQHRRFISSRKFQIFPLTFPLLCLTPVVAHSPVAVKVNVKSQAFICDILDGYCVTTPVHTVHLAGVGSRNIGCAW